MPRRPCRLREQRAQPHLGADTPMWLAWATACREVDIRGPLADIIDAGLNTMVVDDLPCEVAFYVVMSFIVAPDEIGESYPISMELLGPQMHMMDTLDFACVVQAPDATAPAGYQITQFDDFAVTFTADTPGAHCIEIRTDDDGVQLGSDLKPKSVWMYVDLSDEALDRIEQNLV